MRISVELVPREESALLSELECISANFKSVNAINIPDLSRFEIRSWEGCKVTKKFYKTSIPHIRAIDINPDEPLPMADFLREHNITEVLVLTGDPPQDMRRKVYPSTCIDIIKKFKNELPEIKVYAAIDQYRDSLRKEYEYIKRKADAGADGFFTQPFFDLRMMEIYAELLEKYEVYWGVSPVTSESSVNYWETKNNAVFPKGFTPTFEWNVELARKALDFTKATGSNIYLMPIRINIAKYLGEIFA